MSQILTMNNAHNFHEWSKVMNVSIANNYVHKIIGML